MSPSKVPPGGVWAPAITFFEPDTDSLALEPQAKYFKYLSTTGLAGLIILGSNAEAFLLTRDERRTLIATGRQAVGPDYPIIAGCGAHSTAQVLELISDAASAGADYALVLPPAYYGKASTANVVEKFYSQLAAKSPLPIVIYNFPGVCNGVDLDSDLITRLALKHDNIVGVKLTCGSVAKITRLSAALPPERFATFGGQSDFLIGALASGAVGCVAAFANIAPKTIVKIYNLYQEGKTKEALELHQKAALAEQPCKLGIAATKYAAAVFTAPRAGIERAEELAKPRAPYDEPGDKVKETVRETMKEIQEIEGRLP